MRMAKIINFLVVTVLVFSLWVAFALLAVNPYLHPYIPGYRVGRPCGWEFVALGFSFGAAWLWTRNWNEPRRSVDNGVVYITISYRFALFLLAYLALAMLIFLWKYAEFSAGIR